MDFEVRPIRADDAERVAYVHHTSWVETYSGLLPASHWETDTLDARVTRWQSLLAAPNPTLVAVVGDRIVGFVTALPAWRQHDIDDSRHLQLGALYVLADQHGTGIGQALLDAAISPGTPAQLYVAKGNDRAMRFYTRNDFAPDGVEVVDDRFDLTELRMVR
ncbi:GNAT family N-acetyltransferase [Nocardioides sp. NPDC058538]|uniref:GNAT family N-acetyltransferase n=1 Tax=Nocardioides sp. NPDC058538 TaxID=3346542 RepID=UPI00364DE251